MCLCLVCPCLPCVAGGVWQRVHGKGASTALVNPTARLAASVQFPITGNAKQGFDSTFLFRTSGRLLARAVSLLTRCKSPLLIPLIFSSPFGPAEGEGLGHWAYSSTADPAAMEWSGWEGLGGPEPRLVPGLHKVQQVALGTHHALALVA